METAEAPATVPAGMRAVILAGGLGTRLGAVLGDRAKPLMPVAGRPFVAYLLQRLARQGVAEAILCVGHRADLVRAALGDGLAGGPRLRYSEERELLGTGGALKLAADLIGPEPFFVLNGDSFFAADLPALRRAHDARGALATLALAKVLDVGRYGAVEMGPDGAIRRFAEKGAAGTGVINAGVYVFGRAVLDAIPPGRVVSLERDVFPGLVGRGFYGVPGAGYFVDIGVPEDYARLGDDPRRLLAAVG